MTLSEGAGPLNGVAEVSGIRVTVRNGIVTLPQGVRVVHQAGLSRSKRRTSTLPDADRPIAVRAVRPSDGYEPSAVAARVVDALGNNVAAALLGVAKDGPSRWISGRDRPSEESRARLADLDVLVGRLLAAFTPEQATLWLEGTDPYLQARPLDVFRLEGPDRVVAAVRAYEQGAFA